jgi:hypothetical protein
MQRLLAAIPCALCCALFFWTSAFGEAGGTITTVDIEQGDAARVTVTAVFPDNCSLESQVLTTVLPERVIVQIFTADPADPCEAGPLSVTQDYTPPAGGAYELLVLLYDGIPFDSAVALLDNATVQVTPEADECGGVCREEYDQCMDICAENQLICRADCDADDVECLEHCGDTFSECADNCLEAFNGCLETCVDGAALVINPETLNLRSMGLWITAYLTPPGGYGPADIDMATVRLENALEADWYDVQDGAVMIKFSRQALAGHILENHDAFPADIDLTIRGALLDAEATPFTATDTIRVINPGRGRPVVVR